MMQPAPSSRMSPEQQQAAMAYLYEEGGSYAPKSETFNVELPNGQILEGIPVGTTKEQIQAKLTAKGITFDEPKPMGSNQPQDKNYFQRTAESINTAANKGASIITGGQGNPLTNAIQVGGQAASIVSSPIAEAGVSAFRSLPQGAQNTIGNAAGTVAQGVTDLYRSGVDKLANTSVGQAIGDFGVGKPNLQAGMQQVADTGKAAANIATTLSPTATVKGKAITEIASDAVTPLVDKTVDVAKSTIKAPVKGISTRIKGISALKPDEIDDFMAKSYDNVSARYKAVDDAGAIMKPRTVKFLNNSILKEIDNSQINPAASPKTIGAVKSLYDRITKGKINPITGEITEAPITVSELDGFRKLLNGISGEDAVVANKIRTVIDEHLAKLSASDFSGGNANAPKLLFEARAEAAKAFKMQDVADMIKKADGNRNAIKAQFTKYTNKKGWEKGLTAEEQQVFKDAAKNGFGETLERGLGTFGLDLGKTKNVALPALTGGSVGLGVPGGLPLVAAGTVARQSGKYAARGKAQKALDIVSKRNTSPQYKKGLNP